jgi:pyridoxal phosphate enzyme (YggS family)
MIDDGGVEDDVADDDAADDDAAEEGAAGPDAAGSDAVATYAARLAEVRARVRAAETASGRAGAGARVLVATKTQDVEAVRAVCAAGARLVGENRVQELVAKAPIARAMGVRVHLIGPLQRNKARDAVAWADCVETVDSLALAERISALASDAGRTLEVMIQVNVSGEDSKSGVAPSEALGIATAVAALPRLKVRGFMTVGLNSRDEGAVRASYARLRDIRDAALVRAESGARPGLANAWELSMGMSSDLEWAIAEGATIVRIGTAVMGRRASPE